MNYENFKNDFNHLLDYKNHTFCFEQVLYAFNDKYNQLHIKIWFDYKMKGTTDRTSTKYEFTKAQKPDFKIILKSILLPTKGIC